MAQMALHVRPDVYCRVLNSRQSPSLSSGKLSLVSSSGRRLMHPRRLRSSRVSCGKAGIARASSADFSATAEISSQNWVPVIPLDALPRGERRLVLQDGQTILLLWYRNEIYAIENNSPAEGAYAEGFLNAKLTQDGCIICPSTDSTYDLKTGRTVEWYPKNPVLRILTKPLRDLAVYPVKIKDFQICINTGEAKAVNAAEVVFGESKVGVTVSDVAVDEVKMIVDDSAGGFGFTSKNELVNGRAAMIGFSMLLIIELVTGKGLLGTTGFLDFLYKTILGGPLIN